VEWCNSQALCCEEGHLFPEAVTLKKHYQVHHSATDMRLTEENHISVSFKNLRKAIYIQNFMEVKFTITALTGCVHSTPDHTGSFVWTFG
jgi:hypothetical protein